MVGESRSTAPKPYVFVLMPFDQAFTDIYTFGIKGAAEDVGAYAERLDDQLFNEGMLERIFNQIAKADVIVADMTGRNPNVFYEVGYAHALGKTVLLLTQDAADIPFDLKHYQHTVYGGQIKELRSSLSERLKWAIEEARSLQAMGSENWAESFIVRVGEVPVFEAPLGVSGPRIALPKIPDFQFVLPLELRNNQVPITPAIRQIDLLVGEDTDLTIDEPYTAGAPKDVEPAAPSDTLTHAFRLSDAVPPLPKNAVHSVVRTFTAEFDLIQRGFSFECRLRLVSDRGSKDYPFIAEVS